MVRFAVQIGGSVLGSDRPFVRGSDRWFGSRFIPTVRFTVQTGGLVRGSDRVFRRSEFNETIFRT
ncbi:hypothetical protein C5167_007891 [Papaver somniferum]|nr:hypothetical protein C5167_007891 [Papaver somniferum]